MAKDTGAGGSWQVYMIRATDGSYYTGITTDIERRLRQHGSRSGGAKFFRGRKPECVIYLEPGHDRSSAGAREAAIKRLSRAAKELLLQAPTNALRAGAAPGER